MNRIRWDPWGCMSPLAASTSAVVGTKFCFANAGFWALASASSPTFCIAPGRVITKLCGITSAFSSTKSTGRPACTAIVSRS